MYNYLKIVYSPVFQCLIKTAGCDMGGFDCLRMKSKKFGVEQQNGENNFLVYVECNR